MLTIAIGEFDRKIRYFIYLLLTKFKFKVDLLKCNFSFAQNRLPDAAKVVAHKRWIKKIPPNKKLKIKSAGDKVTEGQSDRGTKWPGDKVTGGQSDLGQSDRWVKVTKGQSDRGQNDQGQNDQGTKWPGTKWPGTKLPGTKWPWDKVTTKWRGTK
jgi:hypothetical protein